MARDMRTDAPSRSQHFALLALPLLSALPACGGGDGDAGELPNIVVVTVDTLRVDHLSTYGYRRATSPHLDALAAEGVLFERSYSTSGTTLPSHLSIMTGLYPHQHGHVANHGAMGGFRSGEGRLTAAEILRDAGYATAAFVSGPTVSRATGLDVGFEHFDQHEMDGVASLENVSRRSGETTTAVLDWLAAGPPEPFFLWIHYWDPHEPNTPLEPYASAFETDSELDRLIDERRIRPDVLTERFSGEWVVRIFAPELAPALLRNEHVETPVIDRDAVRRLINLYDGDVLATDAALGRVVAGLKEHGLYEDAVVAFTADHGQALGQHDWLEHGRIQGEEVHVPTVIRFPAGVWGGTRQVRQVVSAVDLFPTLLARLGGSAAGSFREQASGEDVLSGDYIRNFAFSQRSVRDRAWEPDEDKNGLKYGLTTSRWKYYYRPDGPDELYDLESDPAELVDVAAGNEELTTTLQRHIRELLRSGFYTPGSSDEPETDEARKYREAMEALGYIGGGGSSSEGSTDEDSTEK